VVAPATRPAPLNVVREQSRFLHQAPELVVTKSSAEGSGPPPHYHPWDESFYVVSGQVAFGVGDKDMTAEPGTLVHLPAGPMHWLRFGQGGGQMISMTSREAASHFFTNVHRAIYREAPEACRDCQPASSDIGRAARAAGIVATGRSALILARMSLGLKRLLDYRVC